MTKAVLITSSFCATYFTAGGDLLVANVYVTVLLIIIPAPSAEVNWKVLGCVEVLCVAIRGRILFLQVTVKSNRSQDSHWTRPGVSELWVCL